MQTLYAEIVHLRRRTSMSEGGLGMVAVLLIGLLATVAVGKESVMRPAGDSQFEASQAGTWKPWVLTSASQLCLLPPPADAASKAEIKALQALARERDSAALDSMTWRQKPAKRASWQACTTRVMSPPAANSGGLSPVSCSSGRGVMARTQCCNRSLSHGAAQAQNLSGR